MACLAAVLISGSAATGPAAPAPVPVAISAPLGSPALPLRVLPLGASSTVGTASPATAGYRGPLSRMLTADGVVFDFVGSQRQGPAWLRDREHEGHAGATIPRLLPAVPGWVRETRPDVVLLHVGTNDLLRGVPGAEAASRVRAVLAAIWDAADATADPYVIVAGVWAPLSRRLPAKAEFTAGVAALVTELRAQGRPVAFVDTSNLLPSTALSDGLHANPAGYELVARMWDREIARYLRGHGTTRH